MRIYFSLTALGLLVATLCKAAMSWDGSVYLFNLLDKQTPFVPNSRLINIPLQLPVLLAARMTDNLTILSTIFSLPYVAIPLVSLLLSWWVLRDSSRSLFVWVALGVGLATLPGQFIFVSEANIALQLFWPILCVILTGLQRKYLPMVLVLAVAIAISHPFAAPLFAYAAGVACVVSMRNRERRRPVMLSAIGFAIVAALVTLHFLGSKTTYETESLSAETLRWTFGIAVAGVPLRMFVLAVLATLVIIGVPFIKRRWQARLPLVLYTIELLCFAAVAVLLLFWASDPNLWRWANKYTMWAPFTSIYFMSMAVLETLIRPPTSNSETASDWPHRQRTAQVVAAVFAIVLVIQSVRWQGINGRLRQTLADSPWECVSASPVEWIRSTPLNQFGTPYLALLVQGRTPDKVMLAGDGCGQATFDYGLRLDSSTRSWDQGWFDLAVLHKDLVAEQEEPNGCHFFLTSGWYSTETDRDAWWRWSDGRDAQIRVMVDQPQQVMLQGLLEGIQPPTGVDVFLNDEKVTSVTIDWDGMERFDPITLNLERGQNELRFVSTSAPIDYEGRMLSINAGGLTITPVNSEEPCERRP